MRRLLLAVALLFAQVSSALACDCVATPSDGSAAIYRAITVLLCVLPLGMGYGLYRLVRERLIDPETVPHTPR